MAANDSSASAPAVTVGIPAFNNAATIARAIRSIRNQTRSDWLLLISDDRSIDDTFAICAEAARADLRIRLVRQPRNLMFMNFRFLVDQAETPFFAWLAGDDYWHPSFLDACLSALETRPDAISAVPRALFATNGMIVGPPPDTASLEGPWPDRAGRFLATPNGTRMYGLFRTATLQRAFPPRNLYAYDYALTLAALREGPQVEVPRVLLTRSRSPWESYARSVPLLCHNRVMRSLPLLEVSLYLLRHRLVPLRPRSLARIAVLNAERHEAAMMVNRPAAYLRRRRLYAALGMPLSRRRWPAMAAAKAVLGDGDPAMRAAAISLLERLAAEGAAEADLVLGRHWRGIGAFPAGLHRAIRHFERAALGGSADAGYELVRAEIDCGRIALDARGTAYLRAAAAGSPQAVVALARLVATDAAGVIDFREAQRVLAANEARSPAVLRALGWLAERGLGRPPDSDAAAAFRTAAAAAMPRPTAAAPDPVSRKEARDGWDVTRVDSPPSPLAGLGAANLVVWGVHRSGTSALTQALEAMGWRLGGAGRSRTVENPEGYFENRALLDLDERLLKTMGSHWSTWAEDFGPAAAGSWPDLARREARTLLNDVQASVGNAPWVIKDPRMPALAGFWLPILRERLRPAHHLLLVRSPAEVAASQLARSVATPERYRLLHRPEAMLVLWVSHMLTFLDAVAPEDSVLVVPYADIAAKPDATLRRIAAFAQAPTAAVPTGTEALGRQRPRSTVAATDGRWAELAQALFTRLVEAGTAPLDARRQAAILADAASVKARGALALLHPFAPLLTSVQRGTSSWFASDAPPRQPAAARRSTVAAVMVARNAEPTLGRLLDHLAAQRVPLIFVDHGSTDATLAVAARHPASVEVRQEPFGGIFDLSRQLEIRRQIIELVDADWILNVDADEFLSSWTSDESLPGFLARQALATGAVLCEEFVFLPRSESERHDSASFRETMTSPTPFRERDPKHRAFRRGLPLDLWLRTGGHSIEAKIAPETLRLDHYIGLSLDHLRAQYLTRVYAVGDLRRGWHANRSVRVVASAATSVPAAAGGPAGAPPMMPCFELAPALAPDPSLAGAGLVVLCSDAALAAATAKDTARHHPELRIATTALPTGLLPASVPVLHVIHDGREGAASLGVAREAASGWSVAIASGRQQGLLVERYAEIRQDDIAAGRSRLAEVVAALLASPAAAPDRVLPTHGPRLASPPRLSPDAAAAFEAVAGPLLCDLGYGIGPAEAEGPAEGEDLRRRTC